MPITDLRMAETLALSDNQRALMGIAFTIVVTLNVSLAGLAAANQVVIPTSVYFALAVIAVVIQATKDKLGVRDSTTTNTAKNVDPTLRQFRKPSDDQVANKGLT